MASNDSFFKGFIFGGIIGGFLGLLFAPKTGKEFREQLSEESENFLEKAKKDLGTASKAAAHSYQMGKDKFMEKVVESDFVDKTKVTKKAKTAATQPKKTASKQAKSKKKTENKN